MSDKDEIVSKKLTLTTINDIMSALARKVILILLLGLVWTSGSVMPPATAQAACEAVDDNTTIKHYTLYAEYWRNKNWNDSIPYLRWILECAPGFPSNSDRNFRRAVDVYEGLGMASENTETRRSYLDSALYIFDVAMPKLLDIGIEASEFNWLFNKARFMQAHAQDLDDIQDDVGPLYRRSYDVQPEGMDPYYINYIIIDYIQKDLKTAAIEFMDNVESTMPDNADIATMIESWRGRLFTSPDERIAFIEEKLETDADNVELVTELFELYQEEEMRDKVYELAPRLMELDPSASTYRLMAKMRLDDGDAETAIGLYTESLDMPGGSDAAREVHFNIGIAEQELERFSRARASFRRALREDANFGRALIAIGDLYQAAVQGCGSFEREDRAVYWLATDYFDRAAARDPGSTTQARQRASSLRNLYPTAEDKFFKGWKTGDRFSIDFGCYTWIGESTTVR